MKALPEEILQFIKENYDAYLDLTLTMAKIPAPSNHEEKRAAFCKEVLEGYGCRGVVLDQALNVYYPYCCENAGEIHVISAHTDVVFEDTGELPLRCEGDLVYCPGIGDDTANATLVMMLAKYLAEKQPKTRCGILLSLVSGEEGLGNLKGVRKLMETYGKKVKSFVSFDTTFGGVVSDAVGSTRYSITVREQGGHSYGDFGRKNAIVGLCRILDELTKIQLPLKAGTKTTYNVGKISGGISVNTIAPEATALYEYRSDCRESLSYMREEFEKVIAAAKENCTELKVEIVGERPCSAVEAGLQAKLVADMKAIHALYGEKEAEERHSSTDCNIPLSLGIPAATIGTHVASGAHTRGEMLDLRGCERALQVAFSVLNLHLN